MWIISVSTVYPYYYFNIRNVHTIVFYSTGRPIVPDVFTFPSLKMQNESYKSIISHAFVVERFTVHYRLGVLY